MSYNILPTIRFEKELKRLIKKFPSLKREYSDLLINLETKPQQGTLLGNNCYKIRLAIASKGKGKRGEQELLPTCIYRPTSFTCSLFMISPKNPILRIKNLLHL